VRFGDRPISLLTRRLEEGRTSVAICRIIETGRTPEEYDQVRQKVGIGQSPPPGATLHIAARGDDGKIRVIEVWDSREEAEAFGEKVMAAREELGFGGGRPPLTYLELHSLLQ
jgi:hypothetical protein